MSLNISVLILTSNEEVNLEKCLKSIAWCDDVVILDSNSQDSTCEIGKQYNARIEQHTFEGYAKQRNYGLKEILYKHPWVLMLDADERFTDELFDELSQDVDIRNPESDCSMMYFRRKDYLLGTWIKRSSGYPTWFGRLVKPTKVEVKREINEEYVTEGRTKQLQEHIYHYPFNKGFSYWLERHNKYSNMEAEVMLNQTTDKLPFNYLFHSDPVLRRKKLKQVAYSLPLRPFFIFMYLYIFRGGFLEGRAGFVFCSLRTIYEFMIDFKVIELRRKASNLTI